MKRGNTKRDTEKTVLFEDSVNQKLSASDVHSVIAGVSGGADSVAMLLALKGCGVDIMAMHCNFHLRGSESDRDMMFVKDLCGRIGVDLRIVDFNVADYMKLHHVSTEMACRELRYAAFRELLSETGYDRIAVAHNSDDNVETLFLNLMRCAGVSGLRGMVPDTGKIIRPLLDRTRDEILDYLAGKGEQFVTDSTNLESDYRRNFIRNEIIPLFESRWPVARSSVSRTIKNMRQEELMLEWAERQFCAGEATSLPYRDIERCPDRLWLITRFISRFGGNFAQAEEICRSLGSDEFQSGKQWFVNGGRIISERDRIEFIADHNAHEYEISAEEISLTSEIKEAILSAPLTQLWTSLPEERLIFRGTAAGDRIRPLGMKGSTQVSKIMKDAKLSQAEKERVIVAEDKLTGEIVWIHGLKRSRMFLIDRNAETAFRYTISVL